MGIRNNPGQSSYFQGRFAEYGLYQWNIKFNGFESESEIETAQSWAFGEHVKIGTRALNGNTLYGFDGITELLGRPIESSIAGRSGGWLVIDTKLTPAELKKIDKHVKACLKGLNEFLESERTFHKDAEAEAEALRQADEKRLRNDSDVKRAIALLDKTGLDYSLNVDGIKLV